MNPEENPLQPAHVQPAPEVLLLPAVSMSLLEHARNLASTNLAALSPDDVLEVVAEVDEALELLSPIQNNSTYLGTYQTLKNIQRELEAKSAQPSPREMELTRQLESLGREVAAAQEQMEQLRLDIFWKNQENSMLDALIGKDLQTFPFELCVIGKDIPSISIGRGQTEGWTVPSPSSTVSRVHCKISSSTDGFMIQDLKSTNGTFINGESVAPFTDIPLRGDENIVLGGLDEGVNFQVKIIGNNCYLIPKNSFLSRALYAHKNLSPDMQEKLIQKWQAVVSRHKVLLNGVNSGVGISAATDHLSSNGNHSNGVRNPIERGFPIEES